MDSYVMFSMGAIFGALIGSNLTLRYFEKRLDTNARKAVELVLARMEAEKTKPAAGG